MPLAEPPRGATCVGESTIVPSRIRVARGLPRRHSMRSRSHVFALTFSRALAQFRRPSASVSRWQVLTGQAVRHERLGDEHATNVPGILFVALQGIIHMSLWRGGQPLHRIGEPRLVSPSRGRRSR